MPLTTTLLRPLAFVAGLHAAQQVKAFMAAHQRTADIQQRLLEQLVARSASTAFGRDHALGAVRTYDDFTRAVPIRGCEELAPYMQRVYEGDTAALLPAGEEVLMFSRTSGTTGRPKHIPVTGSFLADIRRGWNVFGLTALRDHPSAWLRSILQVSSPMRECTSPRGLPCGAISGLLAATQKKIVRRMYCTPPSAADISDAQARYYAILRWGVARDVAMITTANPSSTIKLIETGQRYAQRLVKDVRDGTFTPPGELPAGVRLGECPPANPELARRIEAGIERDGVLLPRHFWNISVLLNWTGGTIKLYLPRLRELFGGVPIRDIGLLASEGRFSVPVADGTSAGLAEITGNLLEFMPLDEAAAARPRALPAHAAEVGQDYFLVVTNRAGLWRYNMDDRIRVTGRLGQTPVIEFLSRGLHTANITGEKITEHQVVEAMRIAAGALKTAVELFTLQGRFAPTPYYELRLEVADDAAAASIAAAMDDALCGLNIEYKSKRSGGRLGSVRAVRLPAGSLAAAEAARIAARGGRGEQYKHQYLLVDVLTEPPGAE
jgi:hypothetical protein